MTCVNYFKRLEHFLEFSLQEKKSNPQQAVLFEKQLKAFCKIVRLEIEGDK